MLDNTESITLNIQYVCDCGALQTYSIIFNFMLNDIGDVNLEFL